MNVQQLTILALQVSIILTVFGFGLRASPGDIFYVLRRPALFIRSLLAMFIVMPIVAVWLARTFSLSPAVEIALVALAISPVPPLLPNREAKGGGHAAYGLGLMAVAGLLAIVVVPLGASMMGRYFGQDFAMSGGVIAGLVLKTVIFPLTAGGLIRAVAPDWAERMVKPVGLVATILLALGALVILAVAAPAMLRLVGGGAIFAMAVFIAIGLLAGHLLGGPDPNDRTVLALSTASRHPAIALAVAKANFPEEPLIGAAIVLYLLVGLIVGAVYVGRRRSAVAASSPV